MFLKDGEKLESLPTNEIAWSESIYNNIGYGGEKYNPDYLIGRKGFGVYMRMMEDEQVKAVVKFKRDATTSRDFMFQFSEGTSLSDEEQMRRIEFFNMLFKRMRGSFLDGLNGIMSAAYNGFSVTEKIHEQFEFENKTWWGLKALKLRPFETFYVHTDIHGNVEEVVQRLEGKQQTIDLSKFVWYVVNPDSDDHYGGSELKEAYRAWYSKNMACRFWDIWLERHATGWTSVMPDGEDTFQPGSDEWQAMQDVINTKTATTGIAFPKKVTLNTVFPNNNVAFKEAIQHQDLAIAKALLVPNLLGVSVQSSTGSFAQASTQLEAFLWTLDADASRLSDIVNESIICPLGDVNFGDGEYPMFKFKPVSETKKHEIITLWKDLTTSGSVSKTDADENHLRDLLNFPKVDEETTAKLNKDQIATLMEIVSKYASKKIEEDAAIMLITLSVPLSEEDAKDLLATIDVKEEEEPGLIPPGEEGTPGAPPEESPAQPSTPEQELSPEEELRKKEDELYGETPSARGRVTVEGLTRAILESAKLAATKRVDFNVIGKKSEDIIHEETEAFSKAFAQELIKITSKIEETKLGTEENRNIEDINNLKINATRMRRVIESALRRSWKLGQDEAARELQVTSLNNTKVDFARLEDKAADFFNAKSFAAAGKFSNDALATIKNILFNGIKGSKSTDELVREVYETFSRNGSLSLEDAEAALGEAIIITDNVGKVKQFDPTARLRTTIRTVSFEAINEARHDYYTDPDLDNFVAAFEYSAILDDRVTAICKHLDGRVYESDNELWNTYRPPNHFNCRSVLIPVLITDDIVITPEPPNQLPQDGFS